jgi:acyl-CoA reductase-like NAD-dependent aldehyde dehydrogenase
MIGGRDVGVLAMGRVVGPRLAARFARSILELGGNNGAIVAPSADLDLAVRAIAHAAVGTAGQRCTTLRRLFVIGLRWNCCSTSPVCAIIAQGFCVRAP